MCLVVPREIQQHITSTKNHLVERPRCEFAFVTHTCFCIYGCRRPGNRQRKLYYMCSHHFDVLLSRQPPYIARPTGRGREICLARCRFKCSDLSKHMCGESFRVPHTYSIVLFAVATAAHVLVIGDGSICQSSRTVRLVRWDVFYSARPYGTSNRSWIRCGISRSA